MSGEEGEKNIDQQRIHLIVLASEDVRAARKSKGDNRNLGDIDFTRVLVKQRNHPESWSEEIL